MREDWFDDDGPTGDDLDPRPCLGRNTNICVAEGCHAEACCTPGWRPPDEFPDLLGDLAREARRLAANLIRRATRRRTHG